MLKEVNEEEFNELLKKKDIVILDLSAEWCGPCKSLRKILETKVVPKIQNMDDVEIVTIDVDKNPEFSNALNVEGVPTMMFFIKGRKVVFRTDKGEEDRIVGFYPQIDQIIFDIIEKARTEIKKETL